MARIRQRGDSSYQAEVRKKGHAPVTKTFTYREDAVKWAKRIEVEIERGLYIPRKEAESTTFADLAKNFKEDFAPNHYRGSAWKHKLAHLENVFGKYALATITPKLVTAYRDNRLTEPDSRYKKDTAAAPRVSPATVKGEIDLLSKILDVAAKEFGIPLPNGNPVANVRKPMGGASRERRLVEDEEARLFEQCSASQNPWLLAAVTLSLETSMRQGELLALTWKNVDKKHKLAILTTTKNGESRSVPLSPTALQVLEELPHDVKGRVIPTGRMTLYKAFARACERAKIENFTYHDLRHEALSRLAERGDFSVLEIAAVSGHKTLQMLKRYTHLQAERLADKLALSR